jgi:hypothetical protein
VVGVFAYGFEGRLETAESGFPARLFVLPVRTWTLVAGPMAQGITVAVLLWLAWDNLVLEPSGMVTPGWWTVMLAALVATSQALVWLPFGLPWLRLLVAVVVLILLIRAPLFLALFGVGFADPHDENRALSALAAGLIPLAFLAAWSGVSRARSGEAPDWLRAVRAVRRSHASYSDRPPFSSALAAQVWYEWRVRGFGFVVTVSGLLAFLMGLAVLLYWRVGWHVTDNMILLLVPLLIAPFWASGITGESIKAARLTAFGATRPLSNTALVGARFLAAARSAVTAWIVVYGVVALWVALVGREELVHRLDVLGSRYGSAKVIGWCGLVSVGAVLLTWRALVAGQWAGLTGRAWVIVGQSLLLFPLAIGLLTEWAMSNSDPARRERLEVIVPWIAGVAVGVKLLISGLALRALHRRGELQLGTTGLLLGGWLLVATGLFGVLVWLIPSESVPRYGIALGVILVMPMARLAVAPLALAWNRHG